MYCYHCDTELTKETESIEHIIPNAMGGRIKSKDILCSTCNPLLGHRYDAVLCKDLNPIAGFLNIEREKGETPDIKKIKSESGKLYNLVNGRHPVPVAPEIEINEKENTLNISARDEKQLKGILKGLKRKYPNLDDKAIEDKVTRSKYYLDESLHLNISIGGNDFLKAILKIAINFFVHKTGRKTDIKDRVDDLKNNEELGTDVIQHFYGKSSIIYNHPDEVSHTIFFEGRKNEKLLYAFVELFSSYAFVINLNTQYEGPDIRFSYTYDVLEKKELIKPFDITYNGFLPGDLAFLNSNYIETLRLKLVRVFAIGERRQVNEIMSNITNDIVNKTFGTYPEGTIITKDMLNKFFYEIAEEAAPLIAHLNRRAGRN